MPHTAARVLAVASLVGAAAVAPLRAQVAARTAAPAIASAAVDRPAGLSLPPASPWEIEGYGGFAGRIRATGSAALPGAGAPITTSNPTFPSRQAPSWFFGDGASLLNDAIGDLGLPGRLTPLDSALASLGFGDQGGAAGLSLRRAWGSRCSVELAADVFAGSPAFTPALRSAVEASRASFANAFSSLLATGPFASAAVSATSAFADGSGQQIVVTGALHVPVGRLFHLAPYLTLGAGVLTRSGSLPLVTLVGHYAAVAAGGVPIAETDHVTVRFTQGPRPVVVVGAGLRHALSARWGLDLDSRLFIGPQPVQELIDATPTVAQGTPAGFIESFTYPSIQFSNNASTGRVSSLGGPGLSGFSVLTGGLQLHGLVALGLYARF
jgi:hypothetical protein